MNDHKIALQSCPQGSVHMHTQSINQSWYLAIKESFCIHFHFLFCHCCLTKVEFFPKTPSQQPGTPFIVVFFLLIHNRVCSILLSIFIFQYFFFFCIRCLQVREYSKRESYMCAKPVSISVFCRFPLYRVLACISICASSTHKKKNKIIIIFNKVLPPSSMKI